MKGTRLLFITAVFTLSPVLSFAQTDSAVIIKQLQEQIQQLQAQVTQLQSQIETVKIELKITRALAQGVTGEDVRQLQEFLKTVP